MKKVFWLTFLMTVCVVVLFCAPTLGAAFADDTVKVTYVYNGESVSVSTVERGSSLQSAPLYSTLNQWNIDTSGKSISLKLGSEEGADVSYPLVFNEDTTLCIVLTPTDELVTYSYVYNYLTSERFEVREVSFPVGSTVQLINKIGDYAVTGFFSDPALTQEVIPPLIAAENKTFYVRLRKTVSLQMNGKSFTASYGDSVRTATATGTHQVFVAYFDEAKTQPYTTGIAVDGLVLYGEYVRTHFAVTFVNKEHIKTFFVPMQEDGTAIVDESYFPTDDMIAAPEWRIDEKVAPSYPYVISEDTTLYASNGMVYPLTRSDRAILHSVGFVLVLMAVWGAVYEHRKKKRKQKQEKEGKETPSPTDEPTSDDPVEKTDDAATDTIDASDAKDTNSDEKKE